MTFSLRLPSSVLKLPSISQFHSGYVHTVLLEFSMTVEKFDRTLCSHKTVQYFCTVHTELSNRNISKQIHVCNMYLSQDGKTVTLQLCGLTAFSSKNLPQSLPMINIMILTIAEVDFSSVLWIFSIWSLPYC